MNLHPWRNRRFSAACVVVSTLAMAGWFWPSDAHAWQPLDSCRPVWTSLPSRYHVNENGYSRIPLETVRQIFRDGFAAWSGPCCSNWRAEEVGLTTGVGEDSRNALHILSFRETSWPRELGDGRSVLAVNLARWMTGRTGCVNLTGDIIFNGANHVFGTRASGSVTDLQAVATHEQGHWLGLGHSRVQAATMFERYTGEAQRTLHPDDEEGVCSLYPRACTCASNADCGPGEVCAEGTCSVPRCGSDADCAEGLVCDTASGACGVPPCQSDADCSGREVCRSGACVLQGDCAVCAPCTSQAECGSSGFCVDAGDGTGFCLRSCGSASDCPGNTACFSVQGESFNICANDDADRVGICPSGFVCQTGGSPCDGVTCAAGEFCDEATGRCLDRSACFVCEACNSDADCPSGACLSFDGRRRVCVTDCATGADCPSGTDCFTVQVGGGGTANYCLNADAGTAGACPSTFVCDDDVNLCSGVRCPSGQTCDPPTGRCVPIPAPPDTPDAGGVGPTPPADGCTVCATCSTDTACGAGASCTRLNGVDRCVFTCESTADCPGDSTCFDIASGVSICLNPDAGQAGVCPSDYVCQEPVRPTPVDPGDGGGEGDTADDATDASFPNDTSSVDPPARSSSSEGCGCAGTPSRGSSASLLLLLLPLVVRRRRRSEVL